MQRRQFIQLCGAGIAAMYLSPARSATWSTAAQLPIHLQELYPAVHKGRLHVAGGIASRMGVPYFTNRNFAFDPSADKWHEMPELPEDLHHPALVSTGEELLSIGGFNGAYSHVWRMRDSVYRLAEGGWETHSTLPTAQAEGVATFHNGRIHIVTGQQPRGSANTDRSDHVEGTLHWYWDGDAWRDLAPIPTPRNSATGDWVGDQMIVTGGRTAEGNLSVTEIYDANSDSWHMAAPLPLPQAGTASVVADGKLIVFGGEIFQPEAGVFGEVWSYDIQADTWSALPDMPTPRHGIGAGIIDGRIYVIGGATEPSGRGTSDLNEVLSL
ncbi:Kelch repeat-containing protein [Halioglobus pacificus]|uniref:Galactose oxidase n=1 Tax=Parahalioglobus pacificus TaxID=930806 RepID=A0A918XHI8_9GAMM|nr:kelch repeat-containing protein [Halioglobus pacificus]GHD32049.1 hypothetical protein GCM10007053_15740 [Halioglobus pacificus]